MKNLRIAKKNPSKILKIIDIHPATYRYLSNTQQIAVTLRAHPISFASNSKEHKNIESHRERSLKHSPSRSQRVIDMKANSKNRKIRNRSLGSSQQAIKNEEESLALLRFRNSHEIRPKQQHSPYTRRPKFRESQKLLKFHSVSLGDKIRKQERCSKEKDSFKHVNRKRSALLKVEHLEEFQNGQRAFTQVIQNAKKLLGQGQYRKSLLLVKNILQTHPNHLQALYLSAVNWYHLEDRIKTILFLEQIFQIDLSYSAECFKMAAVCYSKSYEYNRSLTCLANCHKQFPDEPQSYDLQGKILGKVHKWEEAAKAYQRGYDISKNVSFLFSKGMCLEQTNQVLLAVQCYEKAIETNQASLNQVLRKMRLDIKLQQFEELIQTYAKLAKSKSQFEQSKDKDEFYYLSSYAYYKLYKYSLSLAIIDEGMRNCINPIKFNKLLLMIRIHERDIYEAFHLTSRLTEEPQLRVIMKFVEGVIELMRRNHQEGVDSLQSIQDDLGFRLEFSKSSGKEKEEKGSNVADEFLNEIRKVYLMFLSYGYYSISQFEYCFKLFKIQQMLGVPQNFQLGFDYNLEMCEGIINHCNKNFLKAEDHFQKAANIYDSKLEPPFSLALNCLQIMVNAITTDEKKKMAEKSSKYFQVCQKMVQKQTSNTAAGVYYFSCLLHGYMEEWKEALDCIDESIERSEDHYWRYFYVRGLLLSCIHSFRQAVNDLSLAIALSGSSRPECYLLRAKCLQIEGQGNEAFKDLQQYISLKPDDPEVHKFAGQLLFQNGAFEDSLVAFSHQPIPIIPQNYDIFLTQGKSLFLLGRFHEAYDVIKQAQDLKYFEEVEFDLHVIDLLDSIANKKQSIAQIDKRLVEVFARYTNLGRIFKNSDFHIIKAICYVYQSSFEAAVSHFLLAIQEKSTELGQSEDEDESGMIENKKDLNTFTNQMRYNIVLCKMSLGEREEAIAVYKQINIDLDQPFYGDFISFKKFLSREAETYKKDQVFPSRNKLSNFIDKIQLTVESKNGQQKIIVPLKLCIPFPKVQPPEIFPSFDQNLLVRLSVLNVERKPEAPWVLRENNSIRFTDKMETYSRFELQDSENESSSNYQMISIDQSHIDPSQRSKRLRTSEAKHTELEGRLSRIDR